jgi:hypothetical protein
MDCDLSPYHIYHQYSLEDVEQFSQELRFQSPENEN